MRGEKPVEGVLVVLAPSSGAHDQVRHRGFQTDSDGSFDFQNVPAEDYLLFAVEDTGLEYITPGIHRPFERFIGVSPTLREVSQDYNMFEAERVWAVET
jgi:hypothetical protein